ncbi:SET domain-containing protein [Irpex rosettiformis]|uniref:SET domain-containing protein n=1 Tax=Irpex rosettiformis TaxID=378272 RepID=A0ACB8U7Y8_9APHY|nr:SET domain-containing protein [Irpex rosettiformis]
MQSSAYTAAQAFTSQTVKFEVNIEEHEETFYVQQVPNKGQGIVAARPILRGEYLFSEPPLFTLSTSPTNSQILGALAKCTREEQCQYFALANSYRTKLLPALAIYETNFLLLGRGSLQPDAKQQDTAGIFILGSRFNSSCTPNVSKVWDELRRVMVFRTLRDVVEGEELCFNYCDVLATREQRQKELTLDFGFDCVCDACRLEDEKVAESDRRRSSIARLFDEVGCCGKEPTLGIRKIHLALRMLKEESLVHYEASFCYDAYQLCVLVSDFTNAKKWIRRAWEISCVTSGQDSHAARMFKIYYANPRSHPLAGLLPKTTLTGPDHTITPS